MSYFLKRVADSKRRVLDRAVAIAAAGASVTARVPFPLQDSQVLHDLLPRHLPYFDQAGILGLSWYRVSPVPSSDISKETSGAVGSKSSDYFGRHTVGPAVVNIAGIHLGFFFNLKKSTGSGTIINKDGTILTCAHVVARGTRRSKRKVEVTLQDGRTYEGKVVNVDMHSYIAILKINSETPLPEAKLGSSSTLRPGDLVIAMGCPHSLQNTVTAGIVSCVDGKSSDLGFSGTPREYLQTDCAVNVGNSGGPLVNIDGEVMAADGLSFSVPIDSVSKIVEHFKKSGYVIGFILTIFIAYALENR
ncbi:putative protease Do-like 14, partial [Gastrolobium bilobum]|uniref:putative protease Do-like 14 n=1 Tax=Gastrolobium bilobum TaxID=150636 RepID=UPI002AB0472D